MISKWNNNTKEWLFQLILNTVILLLFIYNKRDETFEINQIAFFINLAVAAFIVNYWLLPKHFYQKRYAPFFISLVVLIAAIIGIEELILEKIYYPDTRYLRFPGVIFSLVDVVPTILILTGGKFAWDALRKQREVENLQSAVKESELQFLKSQVNPHFLFNNLNNLYAYAIENSPKTPDIILELSSVLRYMLYDCRADFVLLKKEIEHLQHFVSLNELQIEERGTINFQTQNIQSNHQIAPLILVVFIENAFKHSMASLTENIQININIKLSENGILQFNCKNNHQPQSNTDNLTKGIGLENVLKRLELLYPNTHNLSIVNDGNWYEVDLELNLN